MEDEELNTYEEAYNAGLKFLDRIRPQLDKEAERFVFSDGFFDAIQDNV